MLGKGERTSELTKTRRRSWRRSHTVAFSLFRSEEDERDEAQRKEDEMILLLKKAKLNLHRGHHQAASSFLHQAVVLAHQTHNTNAIVYTYSLMANLAYVQGELDSAEKLFKAAMSFMLSNGTPLDDNAVIEMGGVRGEETEGRRYREQEVLRKDTRLLLGLCLDSRARYRASTRNLKQAEEDYKRALDICTQEQGETHPQTLVLMSDLATILDLQGHHGDALVLVQRAVDLSRSAGHPDQHVLLGNMAGILLHKGQLDEAVHFYQEALRLARQNHDQEAVDQIQEGLREVTRRRRSQEEEEGGSDE
uniref:Anaphase-promoting complex subunit 5 domain-containing protein n=1 Tax=Sphaeramia orbicularis TaxID=375764 RepID=A0A673BT36_9TELE